MLSLSGVSKNFGAVSALTDIELDVHAGEVVALVGDNGAGKSTLVKILAGVHQPSSGTIRFYGQRGGAFRPRNGPRPRHRHRVPGSCALREPRRGCQHLPGPGAPPYALDEVAMEVRAWTLLNELSARIPSVREPVASLSGGQRQTVAIARSLLLEPKLIMLDEPTAALGVAQTAEVLNLIERVRDRGLAVIIISHNMEDVRAVADRIVVLRLGRNNGVFTPEASNHELVTAITGASSNAVSRRAGRKAERMPKRGWHEPEQQQPGIRLAALDRSDVRVRHDEGLAGLRSVASSTRCARAISACCRWRPVSC